MSREFEALRGNRRCVLDLDSSDVEPLFKFFGSRVFSRWILNSNHSREGVAQHSSHNQMEQLPDNTGAGWPSIATAFPSGK